MPSTLHHRRSIRLPHHDYASPGAYFVTLVSYQRQICFSSVIDGQIELTPIGQIVLDTWNWLAVQYPYVRLGEWVLMPNHLHGILWILDDPSPAKPLGELIGAFKTRSTRLVNQQNQNPGIPIWQRNYYEHIIRDNDDLDRISEYIQNNPLLWQDDPENIS